MLRPRLGLLLDSLARGSSWGCNCADGGSEEEERGDLMIDATGPTQLGFTNALNVGGFPVSPTCGSNTTRIYEAPYNRCLDTPRARARQRNWYFPHNDS